MNVDFIRAEVEGYGGRVEVVAGNWLRIDVDRTDTRVEVMADTALAGLNRYHIKATGRMGTIVDVLGMLTAAGE